jgi:ATP-dependent RNA helicase HrpA
LVEDLIDAVIADAIPSDELPYAASEYASCRERATGGLIARARKLAECLDPVIEAAARAARRRASLRTAAWEPALRDIDDQLARLFRPGFIRTTPPEWRSRLAVYVAAMEKRLERLAEDPARDLSRRAVLTPLLRRFAQLGTDSGNRDVREAGFVLEELRIQLFAQELGTRGRVSPERVAKLLEELGI